MSSDRVDQLLRRASDDVRATVVRHTVPPPIELVERRHPVRRTLLEVAAIAAVVSLGLFMLGDRRTSVHEPIEAPSPVSTVVREVPPAAPGVDELCVRVVGVAEALVDPQDDVVVWVTLGDDLDHLATQLARHRAGLEAETARRYDRFVALAGEAVSLGSQGGFTPARVRADDALAVAADLVEFVVVPGCEFERPPSSDAEDP